MSFEIKANPKYKIRERVHVNHSGGDIKAQIIDIIPILCSLDYSKEYKKVFGLDKRHQDSANVTRYIVQDIETERFFLIREYNIYGRMGK